MMNKEKELQDFLPGREPEDGKEILEFENYSLREIAEKLKISPETAKHHIAHALNIADKTKTCL